MFTVRPDHNWLQEAFYFAFREAEKGNHHGTQKEQARVEGYRKGIVFGLSTMLVQVGTEQRIQRVRELLGENMPDSIPLVDTFAVEKWVADELKLHLDGERHPMDEGWDAYALETFAELVWPDTLIESYFEDRKKLILDGKLEPDARDAEWLEAHMRELAPSVEKVQGLMAKAQGR